MSDPEQPKKRGFQPGNKFGKGRPKGTPNQFGPGFREKLLQGIIAAGEKRAKKNGVNSKVDGFTYYIEQLVESNGGAAATLLAKLMPAETPPIEASRAPMVVNVISAAEGMQFSPGDEDSRVLLPFDQAGEAWKAHNGGPESWAAYLVEAEGHLTLKAFDNLKRVVPLERAKLALSDEPLLRLVPPDNPAPKEDHELSPADEALGLQLLKEMRGLAAKLGMDLSEFDKVPELGPL